MIGMRKKHILFGVGLILIFAVSLIMFNESRSLEAWRIACITPLTGDGASYGAATKRGIDLAVEKVNSDGGINGKRLVVIYEDDQMNASIATSAIQKLITVDKVPAIIGAFGSSVTLAIAPIAEKNKVVLFSASSSADAIKDAGDYVFRNVPPNSRQGQTAAEFVLARLKAKTASILHMNNDYGVSLRDSFKKSFMAGNGRILSVESYNPGSIDFRAQLTKIRNQRPDVIFYPGHYQESGLILKQAKELGLATTFVGGDGSYAPELVRIAGEAAEGSYYTLMAMGYGAVDMEIGTFEDAFRRKYAQEPDVYSAYAYDALATIAEAIRRGGYVSDGIKSALYEMNDFKGVTGIARFDRFGEVDKPYGIYEVKDGKFVVVLLRKD
jgi:branched-chain amino acid transport system substrate-binding protein